MNKTIAKMKIVTCIIEAVDKASDMSDSELLEYLENNIAGDMRIDRLDYYVVMEAAKRLRKYKQ